MKRLLACAMSLMLTACATPVTAKEDVSTKLALYQVCTLLHTINGDTGLVSSININRDAYIKKQKMTKEQQEKAGLTTLSYYSIFDIDSEEYMRLDYSCLKLSM